MAVGSQPPNLAGLIGQQSGPRGWNPALLSAYMFHLWSGRPNGLDAANSSEFQPTAVQASHKFLPPQGASPAPFQSTSLAHSLFSSPALPKSTLELLRQRAAQQQAFAPTFGDETGDDLRELRDAEQKRSPKQ